MNRPLFLILFICGNILYSIAQTNGLTLSGTITDCKTKASIKGVIIKLVGSDKSNIEAKSDSTGHYSFSNCFKPNTGYVVTTQVNNEIGRGKTFRYGICPYGYDESYGYLNSSEKYKFTTPDTIKDQKQIHDFCLVKILGCGWTLPDFYFKKNSTDFLNVDWYDRVGIDTTLDCFVSFLMARKSWVFEISAHASNDETNKKELAEARAKKLFDLLVSKGIEPKRLYIKSYSDTRPIEFYDDWGKKVTKNEQFTKEKSRRVVFYMLRKDFGIEEAPAIKATSVVDDKEE